jgi:transcriptional regulator with XRE-family HTH domain
MNLREMRKGSGVHRKEFCRLLGVGLRTLDHWESGKRIIPTLRITSFARICGATADQVLSALAETIEASHD